MKKSGFDRYAPFIKEYIYQKQWKELRNVQIDACDAVLDTDNHVLITSGTASGKTEAAFFPILTLLEQNPSRSVGVLYIGPLKALINDQFQRLNQLLESQNIPVWPWHGEVSSSLKHRAIKNARGILQITPESLEAMLMRYPETAKELFADLRFVVIDEIHAFMGADRGAQVMCLLQRLERMTECYPRRIGLSATLFDYQSAVNYLASGTKRSVAVVGMEGEKRRLGLAVESFIIPPDKEEKMQDYDAFLYEQCCDQKCLIFTNSRAQAEEVTARMKILAEKKKEPDIFCVHHGSVSKELRGDAEKALKCSTGPAVISATVTLELGIDIGDLDRIIQIGAPFTCSSFVQRLGRSGRKSGKSQMLFLNKMEKEDIHSWEEMPWDLLRTIAVIQLYLEERWVEPFVQKKKPYSLLAHQTLSILKSSVELSPGVLAEKVLTLSVFKDLISLDEYRKLLRFMLEKEYIEKLENGNLIIGLKGEKITEYYSFYGVFPEEEAYHVICEGREIGTIMKCPAVGTTFVLAGRSWKIESTDLQKRKIFVSSTISNNMISWVGTEGCIHTKIINKIKEILGNEKEYSYLLSTAKMVLHNAREFVKNTGVLDTSIVPDHEGGFYYFPWCGTKELHTLEILFKGCWKEALKIYDVTSDRYYLRIQSGLSILEFREKLRKMRIEKMDSHIILGESIKKIPYIDKYDYMVPEELRKLSFFTDIVFSWKNHVRSLLLHD